MSLAPKGVTCSGCGFSQQIVRAPVTLRYPLPDGGRATAYRSEGWCPRCESIQDVEELPDVQELQHSIADYERRVQGGRLDRIKDRLGRPPSNERELAHRELARLEDTLRWRRSRQSPPRCLGCGSADWQAVDWVSDEHGGHSNISHTELFRHTCGGRLRRVTEPNLRFHCRPTQIVLTPEGQVLRTEPDDGDDLLGDFGNRMSRGR